MPAAKNSGLTDRTQMIGMPLPFTNAEYRQRIDGARARLKDEGLDALLMFHQESMFYLFGYDQLGYWVYQTAILQADAPDIVVLSRVVDHDLIIGLPGISDVRVWQDDAGPGPVQATCDMLSDLGLLKPGKRLGIELRSHALLPYYFRPLEAAISKTAELVDASDLITNMRIRKSDSEVAYVREAGRVMDAGYKAAFDVFRPGVLETEVLSACMLGMFQAGGHVPAIVPPLSSGPRTLSKTHGAAVDRIINDGEPLSIEPGSSRHRYHVVGVQTRWLGTPPSAAQKVYDNLLLALAAGRDAIRPGAPTAEVARAVNGTLTRHGIGTPGGHVGYGTGIGYPPTWLDTLRIKETDTHVLEKNMVFFMMVHWTLTGISREPIELFVGEPLLVTATGCERLSATPLSLT